MLPVELWYLSSGGPPLGTSESTAHEPPTRSRRGHSVRRAVGLALIRLGRAISCGSQSHGNLVYARQRR